MYRQVFSKPFRLCDLKNGVRLHLRQFSSPAKVLPISDLAKKSLVFNKNEGYVMTSPYGSVSIPELTIDKYVWKNMVNWQQHIAIECGITGRKYTFAQCRDHCAALAIRLRNYLKLQQKDIVGICLPNVPGN